MTLMVPDSEMLTEGRNGSSPMKGIDTILLHHYRPSSYLVEMEVPRCRGLTHTAAKMKSFRLMVEMEVPRCRGLIQFFFGAG